MGSWNIPDITIDRSYDYLPEYIIITDEKGQKSHIDVGQLISTYKRDQQLMQSTVYFLKKAERAYLDQLKAIGR